MPRKQNGFGNFGASPVRGLDAKIKVGQVGRSPGTYPGDRQYGTRITRTAVEKFNIDAKYARWRRGYEYFVRNSYVDFDGPFAATFFAGTESSIAFDIKIKRFAARKGINDTSVRYVSKRVQREDVSDTITFDYRVGVIGEVFDSALANIELKDRNELWCSLGDSPLRTDNNLLSKLVGEVVSNGEVNATIRMLFDSEKRPAVFLGNTGMNSTAMTYKVPVADLTRRDPSGEPTLYEREGPTGFIGKIASMRNAPDFLPFDGEFIDDAFLWYVKCETDDHPCNLLTFLTPVDPSQVSGDDPSRISIVALVEAVSRNATFSFGDTYRYDKSMYQQWFGNRYLAAEEIESYITKMSMIIPPLFVTEAYEEAGFAYFKTVPFEGQLKLHADLDDGYIAFSTTSFTKTSVVNKEVTNTNGDKVRKDVTLMIPDLDPYFLPGTSFQAGDTLELGELYSCSCPAFSSAVVRSPETIYNQKYKKNRQSAYPMPSSGANKSREGLSEQSAGIINSWASMAQKMSFKACKHTFGAMFADDIQVQEPNTYPAMRDRMLFEEELQKEFAQGSITPSSVQRSEIDQSIDAMWSISQLIQLSDTEVGSIMNGQATNRGLDAQASGYAARYVVEIEPDSEGTIGSST